MSRSGSSQLSFTFKANGASYCGADSVSAGQCGTAIRDRSCTVTYLPRRPEIHCLGPAAPRLADHNRTANTLALTLAVGFSLLLVWVEFNLRRELRLARIGEPVEGRIIEKTSNKGRNRTIYWVRYGFHAPDGVRSGWLNVGESLWSYLLNGTAITVLYDPDHPHRHRPSFGLRLVRFLTEPGEE